MQKQLGRPLMHQKKYLIYTSLSESLFISINLKFLHVPSDIRASMSEWEGWASPFWWRFPAVAPQDLELDPS